MTDYQTFLERKSQIGGNSGFEPTFMPDYLFPFQKSLVTWAVQKGKAAIFADCGLGKTPMQLVWAQNIVEKTNRTVLILSPLAVGAQTVKEGAKFGIECAQSRSGKVVSKITITNYENLGHFDPSDFSGVVCDESSILKNFDGATKAAVTEFSRQLPYRLLCTATAAPNDYHELGTSSEALGYLGYQDMLTRFFKEDVAKDYLGWGRKTYRFRGHAEEPFWRWVCSWGRCCRKPSDLGFSDEGFTLPPLIEKEVVVKCSIARDGFLWAMPAIDLNEQREERRLTIDGRCDKGAEIAENHKGQSAIWCHLDAEADRMVKLLKDAKQVSGKMSVEEKEETLLAFQSGELEKIVIKPKIGCFGLNWQGCHSVITTVSNSWEQYYQLVRRCYRFGQKNPVTVSTITSEGEARVLANLRRKAEGASRMFDALSMHMNSSTAIARSEKFTRKENVPAWLSQNKR